MLLLQVTIGESCWHSPMKLEASLISDGPVSKLQVKLQTHLYMSAVLVSYRFALNVVTRTPNIHHVIAKIRQSGKFSRRSADDGLYWDLSATRTLRHFWFTGRSSCRFCTCKVARNMKKHMNVSSLKFQAGMSRIAACTIVFVRRVPRRLITCYSDTLSLGR